VFPILSVEANDRVSGISEVKLTVDDRPAEAWHGYLDLRNVSPGKHTLQVIAVDRAGLQSQATSTFIYEPSPLALMHWLDSLAPKNAEGEQIKAGLLGLTRDISKGDARLKLEQLRTTLSKDRDLFSPFATLSLLSVIDYIAQNASRIVEVQILDSEPYFSPAEVSIAAGDTVSWKYSSISDGHTLSSQLHRVEVVGKARSDLLRSGENFSYRFEDPGEYSIRDEKNGQAKALIKVSEK
jgi:plastocyanin